MKDYSDFFTYIVAKHLHKLVDLVEDSHSQKVIVHKWVWGIEKNWAEYARTSDDDSEFIPRISFWIGGLRDTFNSNPSKSQVIDLLNRTFDASTFCYFEYGARDDVEKQIEKYCKEVDDWFNEEILTPKLKKFRLSKEVIPLINSSLYILQRYEFDLTDSEIEISKKTGADSVPEKELFSLFKMIADEFVKVINKNSERFAEINNDFNSFIESCNKLGYEESIFKNQKLEIEEIKKSIEEKNSLKEIIKESFDKIKEYDSELPEPEKYPLFVAVFSKSLKPIDSNKVLHNLYNTYVYVLKRNTTKGNDIIETIESFIKNTSRNYSIKSLENEFKKIKDKSHLKIRVLNLFRFPKKEVEVILKHNSKKINSELTDENGEIIFENVLKGKSTIHIIDNDKEYKINIKNYYNEKKIWLFSL